MSAALQVAGLELGGTKTVVAVGTPDGTVLDEIRFPTTGPEDTLGRAISWWRERGDRWAGLGVGSFGPIRLAEDAADHGVMLATPKPGWCGFPVLGFLKQLLPNVPIMLETDVNAAVMAEARIGAAAGCADVAYITVGTGIGAGILSGGRLLKGYGHPEFGHLRVPRHSDDSYEGCCPFHGDCLEGLASGPAMAQRWGVQGKDLMTDHPAWDIEAWYLAHGILALCAITSPAVVVLGGGVPQAEGLHARVQERLRGIAAGYFETVDREGFVVCPALGQQAGIIGTLMLAGMAAE